MKQEEFEQKKASMSNDELIKLTQKQVIELAISYGKSHKMSIPPMITDTDVLFSELIKRYKASVIKAEKWDKLGDAIARCYVDKDGNELSDEASKNIDLGTIGEIAASAFGWI
jgi:hypothetical protein